MDLPSLKKKIKESRNDGFSDKEIMQAMMKEGIPERKIKVAFSSLQESKKAGTRKGNRPKKKAARAKNC